MGSVIMTVTETNQMIKVDTQRGIRSAQQVISIYGCQPRPQCHTATSIMGAYQQRTFAKLKGPQQISKIQLAQASSSVGLYIDNQKSIIKKEEVISYNSSQCDQLQHQHQINEIEQIQSSLHAQIHRNSKSMASNQDTNKIMVKQNIKIQEKIMAKGNFVKDRISLVLNIIQEDDQQSKPINFQMQKQKNCIQLQKVKISESSNSKYKHQTQKYSQVLQQIQRQNFNLTNDLEQSKIIFERQQQQLSDLPKFFTQNVQQKNKQNTMVNDNTQPIITQVNISNKSLMKRQNHMKREQSVKTSKKVVKGNRTNNNISVIYSDTIEQKINNKIINNCMQTTQTKNLVDHQGQIQSSVDIEEYQNRNKAEKIKLQQKKRKKEQKKIAQQKLKMFQLKKIQEFRKKIKEAENKKIEIESKQLRKIYQI